MRTLKLQVQTTMDGFIAGPNGEMDWMIENWTPDLIAYVTQLTDPIGTILLGRKLAEGFIPHWAQVATQPDNPELYAGKKFTETPKVVFTKTLDTSPWENTILAKGKLADEVNALKQQASGDMITYGGGQFVSCLIKENLIDELHLFVNPVAIGKGMHIFNEIAGKQTYRLASCKQFECGIIVQVYKPI